MIQTQVRRRTAPIRDNTVPPAGVPSPGALPETALDSGHRTDLPGEIREKMESSFGADFSGVRLYESQAVADAGADAVTQGSAIAFAPGKLDLTSTAGQALLGHELSHVVSQARGESAGQGFLNDPHLEAQADRQGMMAAQSLMQNYATFADARAQGTADVGRDQSPANLLRHNLTVAKMHEANVLAHNAGGTPHMGPKELRAYRRRAKEKYGTMGISNFFENEDESVDMAALGQVPAPRSDNPLRRILTIEDTHRGLH